MIVLTGDTRSKKLVSILQSRGWGRMVVQRKIDLYPNEPWGFDNGAYVWMRQGLSFQHEVFYQRLKEFYKLGKPYMAIAPDIWAGGTDSLLMSVDYMKFVLNKDWDWYLAVQDGMDSQEVEKHTHLFSGLFIGGSNLFMWSMGKTWADIAHKHGKRCHLGRVSTKRLELARQIKVDSVDGTGLLWEKKKWNAFCHDYDGTIRQEVLFEQA